MRIIRRIECVDCWGSGFAGTCASCDGKGHWFKVEEIRDDAVVVKEYKMTIKDWLVAVVSVGFPFTAFLILIYLAVMNP